MDHPMGDAIDIKKPPVRVAFFLWGWGGSDKGLGRSVGGDSNFAVIGLVFCS